MADKRERVDITVELEDELSRPARRAADSVDELSDEVDELSVSAAAATASTDRLEKQLNALRRASGSARKEVEASDKATKRWNAAQKAAAKDGNVLAKVWEKTTKQGMKFVMMLGKLMILPAIVGLLTAAAGALSALGAAAYAALAGLSPLVGVLGALPALILGLGTAFAATKLGFKGIGEAAKVALDASKTTSEIEDALRGLTPEGREFVGVLGEMKDETDGWGRSIQRAMLPRFSDALRSLAGIMPVVERGLTRAGGAMGYLAEQVAGVVAGSGRDLEIIFARSERIITNGLTPALRGLTAMLIDFAVAGGPLAERFSNWIGRSADNLARMVDEGRRTGALRTWLNQAGQLAADTASTLGDMAVALYNIGRLSSGLSGSMGRGFSGMISDWRAWTESIEGQNAITEYFKDAQPVIHEVVRMLQLLGKAFLGLATNGGVADVLAQINDELIPAMGNFASTVSSSIVPALVNFGTAFFDAYSLINTTPIPEVLMTLSQGAVALAEGLAALPGPIKTVIVSLIALRAVAKFGGTAMGNLATSMVPVRQRLADVRAGIQLYNENVSGMRRVTATAQGAMAGFAGAGKGLVAALGGPWGIAIAGAAVGLGIFAKKQADAKARVDDLKSSLDAQTGAITTNTRELVAQQLEEAGVLKAAEELGLSLATVTDAALGNSDAMSSVTSQLDQFARVGNAATVNSLGMKNASGASLDLEKAAEKVGDALAGTNEELNSATAAAKRQAAATDEARLRAIGHTRAMSVEQMQANGLMGVAGEAAGKMRDWGDQTQFVIDKTKALNDMLVKNMRSYIGFRQAVEDTRKVLFEGEMTLDLHSQAGRDNRSAMLDLVEAANGVTNAAKRQKALREAEAIIRDWGKQAGFSKGRIDDLVESMIRTEEVVTRLDGSKVNITVTANGLNQIISDADRAGDALNDLIASQGQVQVLPRGGGGGRREGREHGGPIIAGAPYTVGEAGPELFVGPSGYEIIGAAGRENRTFAEHGYVLPNEFYEAALPSVDAPEPRVPALAGGGSSEPVPDIHNHFHGDGSQLTEADIERASLRAWRKFDRERRERR